MEGVVKVLVPDANAVPPPVDSNQSMVSPAPGVAEMITDPLPQLEAPVPVASFGTLFTVTTIAEDVAEHPELVTTAV